MAKESHEPDPVKPADLKQDALDAIAATPSSVPPSDAERKRELAEKERKDAQDREDAEEATRQQEESVAEERERLNPTRSPKSGKDWFDAQYGSNADWFREQHKKDLERELEGAQTRGDKDYAKSVRAELSKLHGHEGADKRPRGAAKKESR